MVVAHLTECINSTSVIDATKNYHGVVTVQRLEEIGGKSSAGRSLPLFRLTGSIRPGVILEFAGWNRAHFDLIKNSQKVSISFFKVQFEEVRQRRQVNLSNDVIIKNEDNNQVDDVEESIDLTSYEGDIFSLLE
jgi:hypothetical protein